MDIKAYLKNQNITQTAFAKQIGITKQLLNWHLQNPQSGWKRNIAEKIVKTIYGEIIKEKVVDLMYGN